MEAEHIRVLCLCYHFPPMGGAGVQRSIGFMRYLPELGFRPIVVAGPDKVAGRWEPEDPSLVADLSDDLEVFRPESTAPSQSVRAMRISRRLGIPLPRFRWWRRVLSDTAARAATLHAPQLIYVTSLPLESVAPALALGRRLGLPVVIDLRDAWELDETRVYPTVLHRWQQRAAMRRHLRRADLVIMNTPEACAVARRFFPELPQDRIQFLTNGYDAAAIDARGSGGGAPVRAAGDGRFSIVHTGSLHTEIGMEHRARGLLKRCLTSERWMIDLLGRSPFYLLQALALLAREHPREAARIELRLIGRLTDGDRRLVDGSPVASQVRQVGFLSHRETLAAQAAADLLFLPMHGLPAGHRSRVVPLKTYEYLASGRPILAAVPEGDARDFILAAQAGWVVDADDPRGLARAILESIADAPAASRPLTPAVTRFETRARTAELARLFRGVLGDGSPRE